MKVEVQAVYCDHLIELFCIKLSDGKDHPAIWAAWPNFMEGFPAMPERLEGRLARTKADDSHYVALCIGQAMCRFYEGDGSAALATLKGLEPVLEGAPLLRGALQYLHAGLEG